MLGIKINRTPLTPDNGVGRLSTHEKVRPGELQRVLDQIDPSIYFGNPYEPSSFDWPSEQPPPFTPEDLELWTPLFMSEPSTSQSSVAFTPPSKSDPTFPQVWVESDNQFLEIFDIHNGMSQQLSPLAVDIDLFNVPKIASETAFPQFSGEDRGYHCPFFGEFGFEDLLDVPSEEESASSTESEDN